MIKTRPNAIATLAFAALSVMLLPSTTAIGQSSGSNLWLEGGEVLDGCGSNYETTLRIRASGGRFYCLNEHQRNTWSSNHPFRDIFKCESASVRLKLRPGVSGAGNLLEVSDEPGRWLDFSSGSLSLTIKHGLKNIRVRAKAGAAIRSFGGGNPSAESLGLRNYPTVDQGGGFSWSRGERWVFELEDTSGKGDHIGGQTYGGTETVGGRTINYGTRSPGVGVWVLVPNWRDSNTHGCSP